jgi:hypothetical protein
VDHAEASAQLADRALEPRLLATIDSDSSPGAAALRAHIAACDACAAELAAWRRTWSAMRDRGPDEVAGAALPPALRTRVLGAVAAEPRRAGRVEAVSRWRRTAPWLAVAAAVVLAIGAVGLGLSGLREAERTRAENAGLVATTAALSDVLADPDHWVTGLEAVDGSAEGAVAWTDDEVVVVAYGLPALGPGQSYRCWVEQDGARTPIGPMSMSGSTGYWWGSTEGWRDLLGSGGRFGVSVAAEGAEPVPVLVGSF